MLCMFYPNKKKQAAVILYWMGCGISFKCIFLADLHSRRNVRCLLEEEEMTGVQRPPPWAVTHPLQRTLRKTQALLLCCVSQNAGQAQDPLCNIHAKIWNNVHSSFNSIRQAQGWGKRRICTNVRVIASWSFMKEKLRNMESNMRSPTINLVDFSINSRRKHTAKAIF